MGGVALLPVLLLVSWPMLAVACRRWDDPWVTRLLIAGFVLKLASSYARYYVAFSVYGGIADAGTYDHQGRLLAHQWWKGNFTADIGHAHIVGTGFLMLVTGAIYFLTGPSILSGFLVFSWLGFWGVYLCYRALRLALPDFDHRRYGKLLFFMPSLLFWPSSIGKEAWMMLAIGLAALGAAKLYTRDRFGYLLLALGLVGTAMVRPHITVLIVVGVIAGFILRPRNRDAAFGPLWQIVGLSALVIGGIFAINSAASFLHVKSVSSKGVQQALNNASSRTSEGGSSFTPAPVHSLTSFPKGIITVLFRPFPWEAHNLQMFFTGLEGLFLFVLFLVSWRRLIRVPWMALRRPYLAFCIPYVFLFVYTFSTFGNYGIITRERVQVLPFVFVLICLPKPVRTQLDPVPVASWPARPRAVVP